MKRVLVTGGAGFIGSHLVEHFQGKTRVRVLDDLRTGRRDNLAGFNVEFMEDSILDREAVRAAVKDVDCIFHLAGMVSVAESMRRPVECVALNVTGYLHVLEEAAAAGVKTVVFSSSASVYGNNPTVPKLETMLPEPRSPYALTKLDGEHYGAMFTEAKKLSVVSLRFFNVFGPRQDPASEYAGALAVFVRRAMAGEPITIYGDGEQTRDFIHVRDIVAACVFVATAQPALTGVYNVGYGRQTTVNEIVRTILADTSSRSVIQYEPERPGDVRHSVASVAKLCGEGFRAAGNLPNALRETVLETRRQRGR